MEAVPSSEKSVDSHIALQAVQLATIALIAPHKSYVKKHDITIILTLRLLNVMNAQKQMGDFVNVSALKPLKFKGAVRHHSFFEENCYKCFTSEGSQAVCSSLKTVIHANGI